MLEAAVVRVPGEKWGERPLAIVVPVEGAEERITADGMIATEAVPDHYTFVYELPNTSVGKIDEKVLRGR